MSSVKPIPEGYHTVSPYLVVSDAREAIDFYKEAFGAEEVHTMYMPGGDTIMHAEIRIGDSMVMISQEHADWGSKGPGLLGGTPVSLHLYVKDVDTAWERALKAGAEELYPLMDAFWGDRYGKLQDPFGHQWGLATHIRDMTAEEMQEAGNKWFASMGEGVCEED